MTIEGKIFRNAEIQSQRNTFALAAMTAMIAGTPKGEPWPGAAQIARLAYEYADAMMAAGDE